MELLNLNLYLFDCVNSRKDDLKKKKITGIIEKVIYGYIKDGLKMKQK